MAPKRRSTAFFSTLLGEEIGRNPEVVAYMPLSPRLGAVFLPPNHSRVTELIDMALANFQPDSVVRNQNTLIIQQAERFVIARRKEEFIFKVAAKRKKSSGHLGSGAAGHGASGGIS
jgi:hypothetical protein